MAKNPDITGSKFTSTTHNAPYAAIDPQNATLPSQYHVCIMGASRDIGANIAYAFAQAGAATIVICAPQSEISISAIPTRLASLNPSTRLLYLPCNVTVEAEVQTFAAQVRAHLGHLDVLIYNAGYFGAWATRAASTPHDFSAALEVNCKGLFLATHVFLPALRQGPRGGESAIVSICSTGMHATGGPNTNTAYGISKLAQCRFIEMLAARESDVFAAAVHPGHVKTEMGKVAPKELFDCK